MIKLKELLSSSTQKTVLLDGGLGSMIEDSGINVKTPLWGSYALLSSEGRTTNRKIHQSYIDAGAKIIQTNTHNALLQFCRIFTKTQKIDYEYLGIDPKGNHEQKSNELHKFLIHSAVQDAYSIDFKGKRVIVANCIGSIDAPYATVGSVSSTEVAQIFIREIQARWAILKDLIIFETLTTREEIDGLSIALQVAGIDNFAIGLTCGNNGKTFGGVSMAEAVEMLSSFDPQAIFIQCTRYNYVEKALRKLSKVVGYSMPIGVYANDGRGWDSRKMEWIGERITPTSYAEYAARWRDAGASIIGGCCGTRPEHIAELSKVFNT